MLLDMSLHNEYLDMRYKVQEMKAKNKQVGLHQLKTSVQEKSVYGIG